MPMPNPLQNLQSLLLTRHMVKDMLTPIHRRRLILFASNQHKRRLQCRIVRRLRSRNGPTERRITLRILTEHKLPDKRLLERGAAGSDGGEGDGIGHWFHSGWYS